MKLIVATRNKGKLKEIARLLDESDFEVEGLDAHPELPEIEEDGATFADNALKKAQTVADLTGCLTLADDSGLEVEALDGQPGVHSARFAGPKASDADNNAKLLKMLADVPAERRQAAFQCVMAVCRPGQPGQTFSGRVAGIILDERRGEGGFGYDPLFLVGEYDRTMAELPMETKNRISHRGQALRQALDFLQSLR